METFVPPVDTVFKQAFPESSPSPMAFRCWAKYFASVDRSLPTVTIPTQWMDFFTLLMLKQGFYEWAKDFLQSPAWASLNQHFSGNFYSFTLPTSQPSVSITELSCSGPSVVPCLASDTAPPAPTTSVTVEEQLSGPILAPITEQHTPLPNLDKSKNMPPKKKRGKTLHISDADLRRSERVHNLNKGFKSSSCNDRNCIGCSANPPSLSPSVVRDLGASFCKLDKAKLSDESLNTKTSKKGAVGRPKRKKPKPTNDDSGEGASKRAKE